MNRLARFGLAALLVAIAASASAQCYYVDMPSFGQWVGPYPVRLSTPAIGATLDIRPGRSYTFEVRTIDGLPGGAQMSVIAGDNSCPTTQTTDSHWDVLDCAANEPSVNASYGFRWCIVTRTGAPDYIGFKISSTRDDVATYVGLKASETTMFSPAWSTNGTYNTYYSFFNTAHSPCTGWLTLLDTSGAVVSATTLSVAGYATSATNTVALSTTRNLTGTAKFAHNCSAGTFLAEAAIANFSSTPAYIQAVKFEPVRQ